MKQLCRLIWAVLLLGVTAAGAQEPVAIEGAACYQPGFLHCPDEGCTTATITHPGPVVEMQTRRTYFLDYPCDLEPGEEVTLILSLHGGGSYANWQRHYFPLLDSKESHRLVIATPSSPIRVWTEVDDPYLQNIVTSVVEKVGQENIRAFWLAGHSWGLAEEALRSPARGSAVSWWCWLDAGDAVPSSRRAGAARRRKPPRPEGFGGTGRSSSPNSLDYEHRIAIVRSVSNLGPWRSKRGPQRLLQQAPAEV